MTLVATGNWSDWANLVGDDNRDTRSLQAGVDDQLTEVADSVWAYVIETDNTGPPIDYTALQVMRIFAAGVGGTSSGHDSASPVYVGIDKATNRITSTTTTDGRTTVVLDVS
jgi:hypothetical protein